MAVNLKVDPEAAFQAIAAIEGPVWSEDNAQEWAYWLEHQSHMSRNAESYHFAGAVSWVANLSNPAAPLVFSIYGTNGVHRYFVTGNGDVYFSERHGRSSVEVATVFGFDIR